MRRFPASFVRLPSFRLPSFFLPSFSAVACALALAAACSSPPREADVPQIPPPPDVAAAPPDAVRTADNLASKVLAPGTGTRHPRPNSQVTVHYTGWTTDGKTFDSSISRGEPATFGLDEVIPGWTEGLQMMVEGEKRRFWIPGNLAYDGKPGRPQGTLVFDVELIRIIS
jgi:peptidylprolyl isomerase